MIEFLENCHITLNGGYAFLGLFLIVRGFMTTIKDILHFTKD